MWDNNAWVYFYHNGTEEEPPFLVQDFIHAVQPDAKFIVMLRDPVERYSTDLYSYSCIHQICRQFILNRNAQRSSREVQYGLILLQFYISNMQAVYSQ